MKTEITEHALETQLHCRLAGVEFLLMEWMHMCMCGPEKEMQFTSSKVEVYILYIVHIIQKE